VPLADAFVGKYFDAEIDSETTKALVRAFVAAMVWIPYFIKSERVQGTFTVRLK
jgi:hypothetical protein